MPTLPAARTRVLEQAGALAGGQDICCVLAPCLASADITPRYFGSAAGVYAQHGYNNGVEYSDFHIGRTRKAVLFLGLPIATPGAIGREDTSGNTGSSVSTVSALSGGVLAEHDGVVKVLGDAGQVFTIGTDQILLSVSLDGGRKFKTVRLGSGNTYTFPFFNAKIDFGAGTLKAGETIHTWHGSDPLSDSASWITARTNLARALKFFRSMLLIGDLQQASDASSFRDQLELYETANERFVYGRASVKDRTPLAAMSKTQWRMTGSPTLTFAEVGASGDTITRSAGSWITDGAAVGDLIAVLGAVNGGNNVTKAEITGVTATVLTLGGDAADDLVAEVATAGCSVAGTGKLTFAEVGATGDTLTRTRGSWLQDGFRVGDKPTILGTVSNNFTALAAVTAVTATVLTFDTDDVVAEEVGAYGVTITAGQTDAAWMAARDAEYAGVNSPRLDLSAGRGRVLSNFTDWLMRRPAMWFASAREYAHQVNRTTWRKGDGEVFADLNDENQQLVEWDDRVMGGAGVRARFTCLRTWANGPTGGFIALSLTRATDGSILGQTQNEAVANKACTIVQLNSETAAIGVDLILNLDGTATKASLSSIQEQVQAQLDIQLLADGELSEGPNASFAVWTPSQTDVYNVPEPVMHGVLDLLLNGVVHSVDTSVKLRTAGQ